MEAELALAKSAARAALQVLAELRPEKISFSYDSKLLKEMKSGADRILEDIFFAQLRVSGLDILSEESGHQRFDRVASELRWVVDPLDGTVNFMRGLGPCSVSLALCRGDVPIFGVIGEFPSCNIAWGGAGMGAFLADTQIYVSTLKERERSIICTGFPSRFNFDAEGMRWITSSLAPYAKVRMLGSASLSLLNIAKGAAEVYIEREIMLWDVAAGLAIVEGAGGDYSMTKAGDLHSLNVFASNSLILPH
jgi:myo-inositol-1(or 4)-monophosphatase